MHENESILTGYSSRVLESCGDIRIELDHEIVGDHQLLVTLIDAATNPLLEVITDKAINEVNNPLFRQLLDLSLIRKVVTYDAVISTEYVDVCCGQSLVLRNRQMLRIFVLHI